MDFKNNPKRRVLFHAAIGTSDQGATVIRSAQKRCPSDKVLLFVTLRTGCLQKASIENAFPEEWVKERHDSDGSCLDRALLCVAPVGSKLTFRFTELPHPRLIGLERDSPEWTDILGEIRGKGFPCSVGGEIVHATIRIESGERVVAGGEDLLFHPDKADEIRWTE